MEGELHPGWHSPVGLVSLDYTRPGFGPSLHGAAHDITEYAGHRAPILWSRERWRLPPIAQYAGVLGWWTAPGEWSCVSFLVLVVGWERCSFWWPAQSPKFIVFLVLRKNCPRDNTYIFRLLVDLARVEMNLQGGERVPEPLLIFFRTENSQ